MAARRGTGPAEHVAAGWAAWYGGADPVWSSWPDSGSEWVVGEGAWRVTGLRGPWSILGPQVGARWLLCLLHWELKLLTASSDFLINYFF